MESNREPSYAEFLPMIKALADEMRLKIIDMLSCGQLCACDILESLTISQPTLSYHMRMLTSCGLVNAERRGTWMHYSLRTERFTDLQSFLSILCTEKDDCICKQMNKHRCNEECTNGR